MIRAASTFQQQTTSITMGPVFIKFVEENSSTLAADPSFTRSSNLNAFATSSLPFFDDLDTYPSGSNRTYINMTLDTSVLSPHIDFDISVI